jgi:hypothetical protein
MTTGDEMIVLERARSTVMAEELRSLLESEGIEAFLDSYSAEDAVAGEIYTEFAGIDVMVRQRDLDRARRLLAEIRRAGKALGRRLGRQPQGN